MASTASLSNLVPAFGNAMVIYHRGTAEHSQRVGAIARAIAVELELPDAELEIVHWAGLLHDLGKLAVPEEILSKRGRLTPDEWAEVHRHPAVGSDLLRTISPASNRSRPPSAPTTNAGTAAATPTGSQAPKSPWPAASSRSPTSTTR